MIFELFDRFAYHQILHHDCGFLQFRLQLGQFLLHRIDSDACVIQLLQTVEVIVFQRLYFVAFRSQETSNEVHSVTKLCYKILRLPLNVKISSRYDVGVT